MKGLKINLIKKIKNRNGNILKYYSQKKISEVYFSEIFSKRVKGINFHKVQTQNIGVVSGKVKLIVIDFRNRSKTKNKYAEIILDSKKKSKIVTIEPKLSYLLIGQQKKSIIVNATNFRHNKKENIKSDPKIFLADKKKYRKITI